MYCKSVLPISNKIFSASSEERKTSAAGAKFSALPKIYKYKFFFSPEIPAQFLSLSSYSQSNPIGLKSNRKSIYFEAFGFLCQTVQCVHINFVNPIEQLLYLAV
jgi:hypothetical protein